MTSLRSIGALLRFYPTTFDTLWSARPPKPKGGRSRRRPPPIVTIPDDYEVFLR
jgi:hypothetical protein